MCFHSHHFGPGARFSKVPKLYGPFSGVKIPFVTQEWRGFKSSNFTVSFPFCYLENMLKDRLSKTSGWQFFKWLFGPEKLSGLLRNGPLARDQGPVEILKVIVTFRGQRTSYETMIHLFQKLAFQQIYKARRNNMIATFPETKTWRMNACQINSINFKPGLFPRVSYKIVVWVHWTRLVN